MSSDNTICVFPGQGSQRVGMGKELYDNFSVAREVFDEVDDALSQRLSAIIFDGTDEELTLTANAQPAIMATSMAALRVAESEAGFALSEVASYVAGHSLGEYSALAAAGAISLADTARLLRLRGESMQKAVPQGEGGMAAIIGLTMEAVEELVDEAVSSTGDGGEVCEVANDNSDGQIVISGTVSAISKACELAKSAGAKRALPLAVSAPFHSSLMGPAREIMADALANTDIAEPVVPVVANVLASPISSVDEIRDALVEQVTGRVRWRESILWAADNGVEKSIEIGEGKVLSGLIRRIARHIECSNIGGVADIANMGK